MLVSNLNQQNPRASRLLSPDNFSTRRPSNSEILNPSIRRVQSLILMLNAENVGMPRPSEEAIANQAADSLRAIENAVRNLRNNSEGKEPSRELVVLLRLQLAVRTGNNRLITHAWRDLRNIMHSSGNADLRICGPGQLTRELASMLEPLVIMTNDRGGNFTREDITRETERVRRQAELLFSITESFGGRQAEAAGLFREALNSTLSSGNASSIRSLWRELRR